MEILWYIVLGNAICSSNLFSNCTVTHLCSQKKLYMGTICGISSQLWAIMANMLQSVLSCCAVVETQAKREIKNKAKGKGMMNEKKWKCYTIVKTHTMTDNLMTVYVWYHRIIVCIDCWMTCKCMQH